MSCDTASTLFDELGGFDAALFANSLFDVDLCLRLDEKGYRIVVTPFAEFVRTANNSKQKASDGERLAFTKKWGNVMERDPFYNPNLSKKDGSFSIERLDLAADREDLYQGDAGDKTADMRGVRDAAIS